MTQTASVAPLRWVGHMPRNRWATSSEQVGHFPRTGWVSFVGIRMCIDLNTQPVSQIELEADQVK